MLKSRGSSTNPNDAQRDGSLGRLRSRYPMPIIKPDFTSFYWSLDGGGRHIVNELIAKREFKLLLEIGVFVGGSTLQWLNPNPELNVIGLDRWEMDLTGYFWDHKEFYKDVIDMNGMTDKTFRDQLARPDAMYLTTLTNLWHVRERFIPCRGSSPEKLYEIAGLGVIPDIVFLDTDKTGVELDICSKLWPETIITGDDWEWKSDVTSEEYPIRTIVIPFAEQNNLELQVDSATWILLPK